jgi:prolyl-tRNA synthetase
MNLYQIQNKFRDEIRPRFGLMRGREFLMKDGYSFDRDEEGAGESYRNMFEAYQRIFKRLGLNFRAVQADSGAIGGSYSHEFMVLAETGEDTIAVCDICEYAANLEKAAVVWKGEVCTRECPEMEEKLTPGQHTVEEVAAFLEVESKKILKTLLFTADGRPVAALVRGDRELNETKLKNLTGATEVEMASAEQVREWTRAPVGFAGPVGLEVEQVYADLELQGDTDWVVGANKGDTHLLHVDLKRDANVTEYADLRDITLDDPCPECGGGISLPEGIEVGHVFKLGTKYSEAMNAVYLDENGKEQPMIMGCYGIGVSRIVASCIEQNNDKDGMIFPPTIAPFEVSLIALNAKDEQVMATAENLYEELKGLGVDVLLDDRKERPGFKFKDADLLGAPMQVVVGSKGLERGILEIKNRRTGEKREMELADFKEAFMTWRKEVYAEWGLQA